MKNFNFKSYLMAVVGVFILYQVLDYLIHGLILSGKYESLESSGLFREDMDSKMWIMMVTCFLFSVFFVYLYHYFTVAYGKGGWKAGLYYGLIVAFLMLIVGNFNQYAVYPVPLDLAWQWFFYGVLEISLVGILTGLLYKPKTL